MKICFVAPHAFPVVSPDAPGIFGGMETRAVTIARGLAPLGEHEISFLVRNPQLRQPTRIDGITWIPWPDYWKDLRSEVLDHFEPSSQNRFRLRSWNLSLLWKIPLLAVSNPFRRIPRDPRHVDRFVSRIDCDLFCCFGNNQETATVLKSAKKHQRPVVLFLGSDSDLEAKYGSDPSYINPTGHRGVVGNWVLQNSQLIITQTTEQQQLLQSRFGQLSQVIPNPIDLDFWRNPEVDNTCDSPWQNRPYFLWIGRADPHFKRPDRLIEIARLVPEIPFLMILNPSDPPTETKIRQTAPANVKIISQVPYPQMPAVFRNACGLINTSSLEGFPNTFLQAIASRIPIISWEVGTEFLELSQAGYSLNSSPISAQQLLTSIISGNPPPPYSFENAENFLKKNYALEAVISQLDDILTKRFNSFASQAVLA